MAVQDPDFSTDPSHRTIDPNVVLNSGWVWMSLLPQLRHQCLYMASMVTGTLDISTDPDCTWATDPDMASGSSLVWSTSLL